MDAMLIALAMFGVSLLVLAVTIWIVVFRGVHKKGIRHEPAALRREERADMRRNRS